MSYGAEGLLLLLIVVVAVQMVHTAHKESGLLNEWTSALLIKLAGAGVGATLAAWWRQPTRWLLQVVGGTWMGMTCAGWVIDYFEWPASPDYLLMSGSIAGLCGYSLLEGLLRSLPALLRAIRHFLAAKAGVEPNEP